MMQFIPEALLIKYIFIELRMKVNTLVGVPMQEFQVSNQANWL